MLAYVSLDDIASVFLRYKKPYSEFVMYQEGLERLGCSDALIHLMTKPCTLAEFESELRYMLRNDRRSVACAWVMLSIQINNFKFHVTDISPAHAQLYVANSSASSITVCRNCHTYLNSICDVGKRNKDNHGVVVCVNDVDPLTISMRCNICFSDDICSVNIANKIIYGIYKLNQERMCPFVACNTCKSPTTLSRATYTPCGFRCKKCSDKQVPSSECFCGSTSSKNKKADRFIYNPMIGCIEKKRLCDRHSTLPNIVLNYYNKYH